VETLQRQLTDVQNEYQQNLEAMNNQMVRFYEVLKQKNASTSQRPSLRIRKSKDGDIKTWNVSSPDSSQDVS
jgi:hypothetical protein